MSSVLAIAGGTLFLVLPVAFLTGVVSISYPPILSHPPLSCVYCPLIQVIRQPPPGDTVLFWTSSGLICILLGSVSLKSRLKPRDVVDLGLALSVGAMALIFWISTSHILETFIATPASSLIFPEAAVVAMLGATVLSVYELVRAGLSRGANGNRRLPLT